MFNKKPSHLKNYFIRHKYNKNQLVIYFIKMYLIYKMIFKVKSKQLYYNNINYIKNYYRLIK